MRSKSEAKFRQKFDLPKVSNILIDGKEVGYLKHEGRGDRLSGFNLFR